MDVLSAGVLPSRRERSQGKTASRIAEAPGMERKKKKKKRREQPQQRVGYSSLGTYFLTIAKEQNGRPPKGGIWERRGRIGGAKKPSSLQKKRKKKAPWYCKNLLSL